MTQALQQAFTEVVGPPQDGSESKFVAIFNKFLFFNQNNVRNFVSNLQFQSFLDDNQLQFLEDVFQSGQLKKKKESVNLFEMDNGSQINLGNEIMPREISIVQVRDHLQVLLPIMGSKQNYQSMVVLVMTLPQTQLDSVNDDSINDFCKEAQAFLNDFISKRQGF